MQFESLKITNSVASQIAVELILRILAEVAPTQYYHNQLSNKIIGSQDAFYKTTDDAIPVFENLFDSLPILIKNSRNPSNVLSNNPLRDPKTQGMIETIKHIF